MPSANEICCSKRTIVVVVSAGARQQLPQQLPSTSENPCAKRAIVWMVSDGVHQQLPQQLPSASEIPCTKRTIVVRVIVGGQNLKGIELFTFKKFTITQLPGI